jgi:hypothetical protein
MNSAIAFFIPFLLRCVCADILTATGPGRRTPGRLSHPQGAFEGEVLDRADLPLPAPDADAAESTRILAALERCDSNRSRAALLRHWSRMTLYRTMKHLDIGPRRRCRWCPIDILMQPWHALMHAYHCSTG